jgi:hypothetical protein
MTGVNDEQNTDRDDDDNAAGVSGQS